MLSVGAVRCVFCAAALIGLIVMKNDDIWLYPQPSYYYVLLYLNHGQLLR